MGWKSIDVEATSWIGIETFAGCHQLVPSAVDLGATLPSLYRDAGAIPEIAVKNWRNSLILTFLAVLGVLLVVASGCASPGRTRSSSARSPAGPADAPSVAPGSVQSPAAATSRASSPEWAQGRFEDVPVPPGFTLDQDSSFTFVQGPLRQADLRYAGSESVARIVRFYQETMPNSGWSFLRLTGVQMKTITYLKNGEVCEVIVESHGESHSEPHSEDSEHVEGRDARSPEWKDSEGEAVTHLHIKVGAR